LSFKTFLMKLREENNYRKNNDDDKIKCMTKTKNHTHTHTHTHVHNNNDNNDFLQASLNTKDEATYAFSPEASPLSFLTRVSICT